MVENHFMTLLCDGQPPEWFQCCLVYSVYSCCHGNCQWHCKIQHIKWPNGVNRGIVLHA